MASHEHTSPGEMPFNEFGELLSDEGELLHIVYDPTHDHLIPVTRKQELAKTIALHLTEVQNTRITNGLVRDSADYIDQDGAMYKESVLDGSILAPIKIVETDEGIEFDVQKFSTEEEFEWWTHVRDDKKLVQMGVENVNEFKLVERFFILRHRLRFSRPRSEEHELAKTSFTYFGDRLDELEQESPGLEEELIPYFKAISEKFSFTY